MIARKRNFCNMISLMLAFVIAKQSSSQRDTASLSIAVENQIMKTDKDFQIKIFLFSNTHDTLFVPADPVFSDFTGRGDIVFKLEKLNSSCFELINLSSDIVYRIDSVKLKPLLQGKSVNYLFDIRNEYSFVKGIYRLKSYYKYYIRNKPFIAQSKWIEFIVF